MITKKEGEEKGGPMPLKNGIGEKKKILKLWDRFLRTDFQAENFSRFLYKHLTQHCGFMAHYDKYGFYATYFENPRDTIKFLRQFDKDFGCVSVESNTTYWLEVEKDEYKAINVEMCIVADKYKKEIYEKLLRKVRENDINMAKILLEKHGIII